MATLFYLDELKRGLDAYGELRFPKEKRREKVEPTQEAMEELDDVKRRILRIMYMQNPPEVKKTGYCAVCLWNCVGPKAYRREMIIAKDSVYIFRRRTAA